MRNNRGWIEIIEAFVAILLIVGAILILLNKGYIGKSDISERVYNIEISILREIQTNETLRTEILGAPEPLPIEWGDSNFPEDLRDKIITRTPDYLECLGKICNLNSTCTYNGEEGKDIYAQSVVISTTLDQPEPLYRQLNLFCWTS